MVDILQYYQSLVLFVSYDWKVYGFTRCSFRTNLTSCSKILSSSHREVFCEKVFLEILQNLHENTSARVSCLIKLQVKKRLWYSRYLNFLWILNFEISKNTFSYRTHLWSLLLGILHYRDTATLYLGDLNLQSNKLTLPFSKQVPL